VHASRLSVTAAALIVAAVAAAVVPNLLLTSDIGLNAHFTLVATAQLAAVLVGVWWRRPAHRAGWLLLAGFFGLSVTGDVFAMIYFALGESETVENVIYVCYSVNTVALALAVGVFAWRRSPGWHLPTMIDSAVFATSVGLVWWVYVLQSAVAENQRVIDLLIPVADILIFATMTKLVLSGGPRSVSYRLLTGGLALMLVGDAVNGAALALDTTVTETWDDLPAMVAPVLLAAAALHPSMANLSERITTPPPPISTLRLTLLATATVLPSTVLVVQHLRGIHSEVTIISLACVVLFVLVVARMSDLIVEQRLMADTDSLTGLRNRMHLDRRLKAAAARPTGTSMVLLDVDHFKSINDRYGHPAGDEVLMELAIRLRAACRSSDVVARYGGEEFVVLLPETPPEAAADLAERIRATISASPMTIDGSTSLTVTVSVGVASLPMDAQTVEELLKVTDEALYEAKRGGRNRVVTAKVAAPA
jgi:two-component system cell cycle response regulator